MNSVRILTGLGLMLLVLAGCSLTETRTSDEDLKPIKTTQLKELLEDPDSGLVLVDVRTAARFAGGSIPGAINIPLVELRMNDARLSEAQVIVTTSQGWQDNLAPAGAKKLIALGYTNVLDYRGGLDQWLADGEPASSPTPKPQP